MELWIRSQDKFDLIQTRSLSITKGDYDEIMIFANGIGVGTYKTKERALEVLDEIQRTLTYQRHKIPASNLGDTKNSYLDIQTNYVYEMPKE